MSHHPARPVVRITLLTQDECHYCDHAKQVLDRVAGDHPIEVTEIDVNTQEGHRLATQAGVLFAPGILLDDRPFGYGRLSERKLRRALNKTPRPGGRH